MKGHLPRIGALLIVLMLTAACFGGGESESTESEPTAAPPTAGAPAPVASTPAAEATVAETPATEAAAPATGDSLTALTVEEAPEIRSYRLHVSVDSTGPNGGEGVQIEGAYIKEPAAEQIAIEFLQGGQSQRIETMLIDGTRYMLTGDTWMQTPESNINVGELTLMTPQNATGLLGQMTVIGSESVNGLSTTHYQGGKEIIPVVGTQSDTLDVSEIASAQLDLWVDDTYNAFVRLMMVACVTESSMAFTLTYDYTDLNSDIQITAPQTAPAATTPAATGDFAPANELGELLGYNLMFPTGSTVETVVGANLYVIVAPFTIESAPAFVETNMQSNGYTQLSKNTGPAGEVIYLFQREQKAVSVTLTDAGNGTTRFQFATGP